MGQTVAHLQTDRWLRQPDALWKRISDRIDQRMRVVEQGVVSLLERPLRDAEIRECVQQCRIVADFAFALDLIDVGRLARSLADLLGDEQLRAEDAPGLAGRVDDLRKVLRLSGDEWAEAYQTETHVHVIGPIDAHIDAVMWHLQKRGVLVTHTSTSMESPQKAAAMAVYVPEDARDAGPILHAIRARSPHAQRAVIHGRTESHAHIAEIAEHAELIVPQSSSAAAIAREIQTMALPDPSWLNSILLLGAASFGPALEPFGFTATVVGDLDESIRLLSTTERTIIVGPRVVDPMSVVGLLRSAPMTRESLIVVATADPIIALQARQMGVDLVIEPEQESDSWAMHLRGLIQRQRMTREIEPPKAIELPSWSRTAIVFERSLSALGRTGGSASMALLRVADGDDGEELERLRIAFVQEFRSGDLVGQTEDGQFIVLLKGASREAASTRMNVALTNFEITPDSGRVGVSEFPTDGFGLGHLIEAASDAAARSARDDGPAVAASDWYGETAGQADVVLVESDHTLASILTQLLEQMGLRSAHLTTGSEALRVLSDGSAGRLPKLLILELDAMGTDGLMILRSLARKRVLSRTKVIVSCERIRDGELREAFELGVDDVIVKPLSSVVFSNRVRHMLSDR